jgi:uncharacterized protein YyaL (SSP411 family)
MADGGIHDQVGGGFHRYATDASWLVPHFEKMLYDNAQLARVYLHAYQLTGERRFRAVAESTLDYMVREMRTPDGLFAASQDADTDGVEGATYVWTEDEIAAVLGAAGPGMWPQPQAEPGLPGLFASVYGVTPAGNWEGRTILSRVMSDQRAAAEYALPVESVARDLELARRLLLSRRESRAQPALDDKAVTAWNGQALAVFAGKKIRVADDGGENEARVKLVGVRDSDGRAPAPKIRGSALRDERIDIGVQNRRWKNVDVYVQKMLRGKRPLEIREGYQAVGDRLVQRPRQAVHRVLAKFVQIGRASCRERV